MPFDVERFRSLLPQCEEFVYQTVADPATAKLMAINANCVPVTNRALEFMSIHGFTGYCRELHFSSTDTHQYVSDAVGRRALLGSNLVIDATYLQFVKPETAIELPNVFVGQRDDIIKLISDPKTGRDPANAVMLYRQSTWVPGKS